MTISIKVHRALGDEFVSSVLITAFDGSYGGCWYWARPYATPEVPFISISGAPEDHWIEARIYEMDADVTQVQKRLTVDAKVIETGIQRILDGTVKVADVIQGYIMRGVLDEDAGDIDATAADCIVQSGLFNEVVYG